MDAAHGPNRHGMAPDRRHRWVLYVIQREPEPAADPNVRNFSLRRERSLWEERLGGREARR